MSTWKYIFLNSMIVVGATGLGRILGFVRETLIAGVFGKSYAADMVVIILTTPDILLNFLVGGALSIAIMPELASANSQQFIKLISKFHIFTGIIFLILTALMVIFSYYFIKIMAPGFPPEYVMEASKLLKISALSIPLIIWSGITASALNSKGAFLSPSLGTAFFNLVICGALFFVLTTHWNTYLVIAFSIVVGAFLRWAIQVYSLRNIVLIDIEKSQQVNLNYKTVFNRYSHAFFATFALMIFPIVARFFASKGGEGQLANLNYIQKLMDLPIGLLVGSMATVLLPKIINVADKEKTIKLGVILISISCALIAAIMSFFSIEIITVFFGHGAFGAEDIAELARQLKLASLMLPFYGIVVFLVSTLAVTPLSRQSAYSCLLGVITFCLLNTLFVDQITPNKIYQNLIISYIFISSLQIYFFLHKKGKYASIDVHIKGS
jgi:putative peptidoglycan lipid II flippase